MQDRPAPPVTIEGGPGWQLDGPGGELLGDDPQRRPLPRPPRLAVLTALTLAVGFAAGALWQDWRVGGVGERAAGALSLEATGIDDVPYSELVDDDRGRLSTVVVVALRNTGPREVELRTVAMPGTGFAADDVDGVRVRPGSSVRVELLRPVDCADPRPAPAQPLQVRARTDAGEREQRLYLVLSTYDLSGTAAATACGQVPPVQALSLVDEQLGFAGAVARVRVEARNTSAGPIVVRTARALPGLSVRLLGADDRPLSLPIELPAADYSVPRRPTDPALPARRLVAELAVVDCALLPDLRAPSGGLSLVELDVDGLGGAGGTTFLGDVFAALPRLRAQSCG